MLLNPGDTCMCLKNSIKELFERRKKENGRYKMPTMTYE